MPQPIRESVTFEDLSTRLLRYGTVDASPAAAAETVIATLTIPNFGDLAVVSGIQLRGWLAFTVGTAGVSATLRIRQTNVSGTVVKSSGATTVTAANLLEMSVSGFDVTPGVSAYALTLTVGSASAASTVSAVELSAIVV